MRYLMRLLVVSAGLLSLCATAETDRSPGAEVTGVALEEQDHGWIELLTPDLKGWKATGKREAFSFVDGALECDGSGGKFFYYSLETFQDFEIQAQIKISERANSGIFLRVSDPEDEVQTGIEVQVLDSHGKRVPGKHDFGAIYDIREPAANAANPAGEWNDILVSCRGSRVRVELNQERVVDLDLNQWTQPGKNPDGTANKFRTAYKDLVHAGYIGFQDHGARVWYRDVKVRKVD